MIQTKETNSFTEHSQSVPNLRFPEFDETWIRKNLGDVCEIKTGNKDTQNRVDDGKYPFFVRSNTVESINTYSFDGEAILTSGDGVGVGKNFHYINGKFDYHQRVYALRNFEKDYSGKYIYHVFSEKFYKRVLRLSAKNSVDSVRMDFISKMEMGFPPLPEQQKIASFLTAVDTKIEQLTKKKTLLEQYKKGVMQKIFGQEIRFKDEKGEDYPDWEERKLGEIANFRRGSFPQPYGLSKWYDDENGFPFIQVFDVAGDLRLKETTKRKISEAAKELSVLVKKGTLILTIQGSIGRMAITEYDACIDRTLLIFQSYKLPIDKVFFMYTVYLLFEFEKQRAVGGTIKTITKEKLSEFKVRLPSLEEQTQIADFLSTIDDKIKLVNTQLEKTQGFKKGLLQQMFV